MQLMWFRNDLRSIDNLALQSALARQTPTCALYIHCPGQMEKHDVGPNRQLFHLQHVKLLFQELEQAGLHCFYCEIDHFDAVPELLKKYIYDLSLESLWFNREYGHWETQRDEAVRLCMAEQGVGVHTYDDSIILPAHAVLQKTEQPYKVFSPFKRRWLAVVEETSLAQFHVLPQSPRITITLPSGQSQLDDRIQALKYQVSATVIQAWPVEKGYAQHCLDQFLELRVRRYDQSRNIPNTPGTSQLSPYLASGVLSARQLYQAGKISSDCQGQQVWLSELIWRDFYRHIMIHFPRVSRAQTFKPEYDTLQWRQSQSCLEAWKSGATGVPLVDAGLRQLQQTGWMHNRVRMVVAMFLSKNLLLDWKDGERHFMRLLVDGDFASNNGGWQWSASVGTDAAPYFRIFNPLTQAVRFDPEACYIKRYVPELEAIAPAHILNADKNQSVLVQAGYSPLMVDLKQTRQAAIDLFKHFKTNNSMKT